VEQCNFVTLYTDICNLIRQMALPTFPPAPSTMAVSSKLIYFTVWPNYLALWPFDL